MSKYLNCGPTVAVSRASALMGLIVATPFSARCNLYFVWYIAYKLYSYQLK